MKEFPASLEQKKITLADCIDIALQNSPNTRQAWQTAKEAEAQARQSLSQLYPAVTLSMDMNYSKGISRALYYDDKIKGVDQHINFGPCIDITYLILDAGGMSASIKGAIANLYQQNFLFNQSVQDLFLATETAYFNYCAALERVETYKDNVKEAYKVLRIISARCKGGLAAKLDVYQAKARFENERYNLAQAEGDLEGAKADLTKAMGVSAFSVFTITRPEKEFAVTLDQEIVTRLISQGLEKRQDIAALRASVIQREYAVNAARSKLWPSLNLEGLGDYSRYNSYHKPINEILTNKYTSTMNTSIGVSLQWDVFDGFSNYYNKVAAEKDLEAERQKLKQLEIEAATLLK